MGDLICPSGLLQLRACITFRLSFFFTLYKYFCTDFFSYCTFSDLISHSPPYHSNDSRVLSESYYKFFIAWGHHQDCFCDSWKVETMILLPKHWQLALLGVMAVNLIFQCKVDYAILGSVHNEAIYDSRNSMFLTLEQKPWIWLGLDVGLR